MPEPFNRQTRIPVGRHAEECTQMLYRAYRQEVELALEGFKFSAKPTTFHENLPASCGLLLGINTPGRHAVVAEYFQCDGNSSVTVKLKDLHRGNIRFFERPFGSLIGNGGEILTPSENKEGNSLIFSGIKENNDYTFRFKGCAFPDVVVAPPALKAPVTIDRIRELYMVLDEHKVMAALKKSFDAFRCAVSLHPQNVVAQSTAVLLQKYLEDLPRASFDIKERKLKALFEIQCTTNSKDLNEGDVTPQYLDDLGVLYSALEQHLESFNTGGQRSMVRVRLAHILGVLHLGKAWDELNCFYRKLFICDKLKSDPTGQELIQEATELFSTL